MTQIGEQNSCENLMNTIIGLYQVTCVVQFN